MAKINTDKLGLSTKRIQIDKSNTKVLIYICLATVALIFALVAAQALWKQIQYQNKVLSLRNKAIDQLEKNKKATAQLQAQYVAFDTASESIIGNSDANSKVVLNALPSKYDFPALATSLENLVNKSGVTLVSITGTDDQLNAKQSSIEPQPVDIPFSLSVKGSYDSIKTFISNLEKSTRPMKITKISFSGSEGTMQVDIAAVTQYQPLKILDLDKKQVPQGGAKTSVKTQSSTSQQKESE